ncbi:MAG: TRAP transporter large permease [Parvibaculaceae bacterium]
MLALLLIALSVLLILGVPIAFILVLSALIPLIEGGFSPTIIPQRLFAGMDFFTLLAIPFFVLAGELMFVTGITVRLMRIAVALVGHMRGGLGQVVVATEYLFSGISGSTVADAAAVGSVAIPALEENGYSREKAAGIVCGACAAGMLVPPSISLIVYGALANVSIAALFVAGFLPAAISCAGIMALVYLDARRAGIPVKERADWREIKAAIKQAGWVLLMPVIVFGGILSGVFTATEAGVAATFYALFVGTCVYRQLDLAEFGQVLVRTATMTGVVMLLIGASNVFGWFLVVQQVPQSVVAWVVENGISASVVIMIVILLFLLLGAFMDGIPAMIMAVPVLLPVFALVGLDPFHMGIVIVATTGIGLFTPPVGAGLFVACKVGRVSIEAVTVTSLPYLAVIMGSILLIAYVPWTVTVLPRLFGLI